MKSLKDIVLKKLAANNPRIEQYVRLSDELQENMQLLGYQSFAVKRYNINFNNKECQLLTFHDLSTT